MQKSKKKIKYLYIQIFRNVGFNLNTISIFRLTKMNDSLYLCDSVYVECFWNFCYLVARCAIHLQIIARCLLLPNILIEGDLCEALSAKVVNNFFLFFFPLFCCGFFFCPLCNWILSRTIHFHGFVWLGQRWQRQRQQLLISCTIILLKVNYEYCMKNDEWRTLKVRRHN